MLVIRMQRTGRKGHAMFRVVVQDSRQAPTSGKVVARLGSYDPHAKTLVLDKEKAAFYLEHGAQPSDRAIRLLKDEGVKLPAWVKEPTQKKRAVRNPDKRRSTAPEKPAEESEKPAEESEKPAEEAAAAEAPSEEPAEGAEATAAGSAETGTDAQDASDDEGGSEEPSATAEPEQAAEPEEATEPKESGDSAGSEDAPKDEA